MEKNKKQIVITISLIIILILAVIGVSYAAFEFVGRGEKVNQITTGTISMEYTESDNVITINNALPTTDETGKVRLRDGEYFDFSVTTNLSGDAVINYEIAAEDFEDNTFDGANVKFYLTKLVGSEEEPVNGSLPAVYSEQVGENKKTGRPANMMNLLSGSTSTQGEETIKYRLRLYVDEEYNPQGDGGNLIFKTRINVYGKVSTEKDEVAVLPVMKSYSNCFSQPVDGLNYFMCGGDFHDETYKYRVTNIVTKKDTLIPDTALPIQYGNGNYWDVSEAGDGSVIAYIEEKSEETVTVSEYDYDLGKVIKKQVTAYKATIGGKGGVIANTNSIYLFCDFLNLKEIDLSNLDTSNVEGMVRMFAGCSSLVDLDLSHFNTSNVTDMSEMFGTEFSVSSATDNYLTCNNLKNLNLSSFDTSNVTNMSSMFCGCSSLTNITVSNLWITENANTNSMFSGCGTDHLTVV